MLSPHQSCDLPSTPYRAGATDVCVMYTGVSHPGINYWIQMIRSWTSSKVSSDSTWSLYASPPGYTSSSKYFLDSIMLSWSLMSLRISLWDRVRLVLNWYMHCDTIMCALWGYIMAGRLAFFFCCFTPPDLAVCPSFEFLVPCCRWWPRYRCICS